MVKVKSKVKVKEVTIKFSAKEAEDLATIISHVSGNSMVYDLISQLETLGIESNVNSIQYRYDYLDDDGIATPDIYFKEH